MIWRVRTCSASGRLLHHFKFFEGVYPCASSSNVFVNYHVFFCIFFFYRYPGEFESRKQKESRAINEQEEEEEVQYSISMA